MLTTDREIELREGFSLVPARVFARDTSRKTRKGGRVSGAFPDGGTGRSRDDSFTSPGSGADPFPGSIAPGPAKSAVSPVILSPGTGGEKERD